MLVQWVCLGRVVFGEYTPDVSITTAIEFARLADMCCVTGMESPMAELIKAIILVNLALGDWKWDKQRAPETLIASRPSTLIQQPLCQRASSVYDISCSNC